MKNKKGFTLIELLAVIVILAIIMVIATMQVNKTIKKARQDSLKISAKSLKKQVEQKMAMGEDYLCYDCPNCSTGKKEAMYGELHDLFANNFFSICGNGIDEGGTGLSTSPRTYRPHDCEYQDDPKLCNPFENDDPIYLSGALNNYGTHTCQELYDISDDYRMWVSEQVGGDHISIILQPSGNSKFGGSKYVGESIHKDKIDKYHSTPFLDQGLKIKYEQKKDKKGNTQWFLAGMSIAITDNDACKYEYQWNHFANYGRWNTNSYQCLYQWNNNKIAKINEELVQLADKEEYEDKNHNKYRLITMKNACKALTNDDNFEGMNIEKKDDPANWIKPKENNK